MATRYSKQIRRNARYVYKRCYKDFCLSDYIQDLAKISWWAVYQCTDVNLAVDLFTEKLVGTLDCHAPMRIIQTRVKYASWLSIETKKIIHQRNIAQNKASSSQKFADWENYRKLRNEVTKRIRQDQKNWHQEKLNSCANNSSGQWQHVLGCLGWKSYGSPTQLFHEGRLINKPLEIADCQSRYFINKVKLIQQNLPPSVSDPLACLKRIMQHRSSSFHLQSVHPDTIENIVKSLKNSKSAGLDNLDTQIIKQSLPYVLPALTHIINLSVVSGCFPSKWKVAKVIPLYKKDDPLDPKNYRPVAILPVLSKILERVIFIQIRQYMEENRLIHPNHHGFIEENKFTGVCFLDLSAAFDIVDHSLLLQKLKLYGFDDNSLTWIKSYLEGRYQSVYIEGKMSEALSVTSGVPQGSILGPLLYIIFTNELPEIIHNHADHQAMYNMKRNQCGSLCCYADDSTFSVASSNIDTISSQILERYNLIAQFVCNNRLRIYGEKAHIMLISTGIAWRLKLTADSLIFTTENNISICPSSCENLPGGVIAQNLKKAQQILFYKKSLVKQLGFRRSALKKICQYANF